MAGKSTGRRTGQGLEAQLTLHDANRLMLEKTKACDVIINIIRGRPRSPVTMETEPLTRRGEGDITRRQEPGFQGDNTQRRAGEIDSGAQGDAAYRLGVAQSGEGDRGPWGQGSQAPAGQGNQAPAGQGNQAPTGQGDQALMVQEDRVPGGQGGTTRGDMSQREVGETRPPSGPTDTTGRCEVIASVKAHMYVLVARCPALAKRAVPATGEVMTSRTAGEERIGESSEGQHVGDPSYVIELSDDVTREAIKEILKYLYYEKSELTQTNVFGVLHAARKFYQVPHFIEHCLRYIKDSIAVGRVCDILDQALFYNEKTIVDECTEFISRHTLSVLRHPNFLRTSESVVHLIVSQDYLTVDEIDLFEYCVRWARKRSSTAESHPEGETAIAVEWGDENEELVGEGLRKALGRIVKENLIRFPVMSISDFSRRVVCLNVLNPEETVEVYSYLAYPAHGNTFARPATRYVHWKRHGQIRDRDQEQKTDRDRERKRERGHEAQRAAILKEREITRVERASILREREIEHEAARAEILREREIAHEAERSAIIKEREITRAKRAAILKEIEIAQAERAAILRERDRERGRERDRGKDHEAERAVLRKKRERERMAEKEWEWGTEKSIERATEEERQKDMERLRSRAEHVVKEDWDKENMKRMSTPDNMPRTVFRNVFFSW